MPKVTIEVRQPRSRADEEALIEAVHSALVEAFRIPSTDRNVKLSVHEPHRLQAPARLARPDLFTFIRIDEVAA